MVSAHSIIRGLKMGCFNIIPAVYFLARITCLKHDITGFGICVLEFFEERNPCEERRTPV